VELKTEAVNEVATRNIAAVIRDLDAEVLAVVEAESRPALQRFNQEVLRLAPGDDWEESFSERYAHIMLIDGNDDRGIDVGLMTRLDHAIGRMRSHVDDGPWDRPIFSRDCPEYEVTVPDGDPVLLMVNHFKSKGYRSKDGTPPDAKREQQAKRVAEIYAERRAEGSTRIIVAGDLNDTPDSAPLAPLLQQTDLRDASEHENFDFGERRGTYGTGNEQFDYLLLTPELFELMSAGGINRKGVWHGPRVKNPWEMLPTLTREIEAASDHAAIWADLDL
jgi:endonuclease/exonuclease/phosphatase family metal-dependent hydrolase